MRKDIVATQPDSEVTADIAWLDVESIARIRLTSEDPAHPIESALREGNAQGWRAAQPGTQTIWIGFDAPQSIRQIALAFDISHRRTQEFLLSWSSDGGVSYKDIVRQQYNFSPDSHREEENYFPNLDGVTDLKLMIIPDISDGTARATLQKLRLR